MLLSIGILLAPSTASAVFISEAKFVELGGKLAEIDASFPEVTWLLRQHSLSEQFLAVGRIDGCTATWLGEQGPHTYLLTAAHCVSWSSGQAVANSVTFLDWRGKVIAQGKGWAFTPVRTRGEPGKWEIHDDIAVLRLPRVATPVDSRGRRLEPPTIAEKDLSRGETIHFVGYGHTGVGRTYRDLPGGQRRITGEAAIEGFFDDFQGVYTRSEHQAASPSWAFTRPGDSGSAWWRTQHGYWQVSAVSSGGTNWPSPQSLAPHVPRHAAWIHGIFPGAVLQSERMAVTESQPFVSRNHVRDPSGQRVHFIVPAQADVTGPSVSQWSGADGHSVIRVMARESRTGALAELRLRAHRDAGCRRSAMEDAAPCPAARSNRLQVAFLPDDNPRLKPGVYTGRFDVEVLAGMDRSRQERLTLHLDIRHLLRGRVTPQAAYRSPNLAEQVSQGTVYYTVPAQDGTQGPRSGLWSGSPGPSRIEVTVRDAVTGQRRQVHLRAERDPLCGGRSTRMEDGSTCQRAAAGPVTVGFHAEDNPGLPAGLHRGRLLLQARGWMDRDFEQLIELDIDLDTLDASAK
jgi:hypothetical protein